MEETIQLAEQWYVAATSSRTDDRTRVLKHGETFAVLDRFGDIHRIGTGEQGIYHSGTRFLSRLELRVNGRRPMLLNSSIRLDNSLLTVDLTTPDLGPAERPVVRKGTVHLFRAKLLWQHACTEHLRVTHYGEEPVSLTLVVEFAADYADIFEVRGLKRAQRGRDLAAEISMDCVTLGYEGLDGKTRRTRLRFSPPPAQLSAGAAEFALDLAPGEKFEMEILVDCDPDAPRAAASYHSAFLQAGAALREGRNRGCQFHSSNDQFNDWISRSAADLHLLTTGNPEGAYPYAGVPWFSTPFGRDGILTALFYLWVDPTLARSVLLHLAKHQAEASDPERDAEPGKILHETRGGELAALGEIPFGLYYGSIDSTPLFVILAGAYFQRTGDLALVERLWPNIQRALDWIDRHGDCDGDGFVEYLRRSSTGLVNQGWKDSHDAVFHADGTLAEGSVALAEVQGYVYLARLHAADLAELLGDATLAARLRSAAGALRLRFETAFWCEAMDSYAIALDGDKQPCRVRSSNAGQVLWSGIASPEHARRTAETLMAPASFSGWGVRTIAEGEPRYNPMSYHDGSVWPHDNALIGAGLARYGMKDKTGRILAALFEASLFMDMHRLPELYCGFVRREDEGPTLYPVACSPQAWASASVFYLLQACLGLSFHAEAPCLRLAHPQLPTGVNHLMITDLRIADAVVDLVLERHGQNVAVKVARKEGEAEVAVVL